MQINEQQIQLCKSKQKLFLKKAANFATKSNVRSNRHGCVIVKDNEIISEGYNHYTNYLNHEFTIHAEVDAIIKLKKMNKNLVGCELYVVRIGTDNMGNPLKYSRPCIKCTNEIIKTGIRKVYFST